MSTTFRPYAPDQSLLPRMKRSKRSWREAARGRRLRRERARPPSTDLADPDVNPTASPWNRGACRGVLS